jgi:hypothetical protein
MYLIAGKISFFKNTTAMKVTLSEMFFSLFVQSCHSVSKVPPFYGTEAGAPDLTHTNRANRRIKIIEEAG